MHPWYRGFNGVIEQIASDRYKISGMYRKISSTVLEVTELPIRSWTQSYKEMLESMLKGDGKLAGFIQDYKEYHTDNLVHFKVYMSAENMSIAEAEGFDKKFKLSSTLSTGNMVGFSSEGRIKKYADAEEILQEFYDIRLRLYQKRKEHLADLLTNEWTKLDNKVKFVLEIIKGKLVIQNRKKKEILKELQSRGYKQFSKKTSSAVPEDEDAAGEEQEDSAVAILSDGYDYLLSMPLWNLTMEKVEKLIAEKTVKETELNILLGKTPKDLWIEDLDAFAVKWNELLKGYQSDCTTIVNSSAIEEDKNRKTKVADKKRNVAVAASRIGSASSSKVSSPIGASKRASPAAKPLKTTTSGKSKPLSSAAATKKAFVKSVRVCSRLIVFSFISFRRKRKR